MALIVLFYASTPPADAGAKVRETRSCALGDIETRSVPDPISGRSYDIQVSLPSDYDADTSKRRPVLYLADGGRAMPRLPCLVRALYSQDSLEQEPIIVGLSYGEGENLEASRKRDYSQCRSSPAIPPMAARRLINAISARP